MVTTTLDVDQGIFSRIAQENPNPLDTHKRNVFDISINVMDFDGTLMGWFPNLENTFGATGSLIQNSNYKPSQEGTLVYFMSNDVQVELDRVDELE